MQRYSSAAWMWTQSFPFLVKESHLQSIFSVSTVKLIWRMVPALDDNVSVRRGRRAQGLTDPWFHTRLGIDFHPIVRRSHPPKADAPAQIGLAALSVGRDSSGTLVKSARSGRKAGSP